jgi:potassium-transporting ATPase KdpC subunit
MAASSARASNAVASNVPASNAPASNAPAPQAAPSAASLLRTSLGMLAILTLITGVLYPLLITGVAQAAFRARANGSVIVENGVVRGSELLGQPFDDPKHFWGRLSATTPAAYNGGASTGSNLGPMNDALTKAAQARIDALRAADPENHAAVPVDLVTASGSGLDPHITPAAAEYQVRRVARAHHLPEERVRALVRENTEGRTLGVLGEPRVNVLMLNLALDRL